MNIIEEPFVNDVNLAICVFPPDTLYHDALKEKMMEYTTFYAMRLNQLIEPDGVPIDVFHALTIESGLHDLADKYDHILLMSAGSRILDMSVIFDIKRVIEEHDNYFVGAHILHWQEAWYELHHQFLLVNSKKWISSGSPAFGGWVPKTEQLPVIERSVENFHDDYTPLWIKFTGEFESISHQKQGWNFIKTAGTNGYEIFNWDSEIRRKRTYYYPEDHSEQFYRSLINLADMGIENMNQKNLINQCVSVADQIWLLNTENMSLEIPEEKFDTLIYTASGFKFLDAFHADRLNDNGKLVIYDFNPKSLEWIKLLHTSTEVDILELIKQFEYKDSFKVFGPSVFGDPGHFTKEFLDSFKVTMDFFGGKKKFYEYLRLFRNTKVEFVQTNIFEDPSNLVDSMQGKTVINLSNIFCTDFTNAHFGMTMSHNKLKEFISKIKTECLVLGQDAYCRPLSKRVIPAQA